MQLAALIPAGLPIIDLGSGGGFPGLILAISTGNPVTLIEADTRKAAFLREARALAPLQTLLGWAAPLLLPDGYCLFLKGRSVEDELTDAAARWHMTIKRTPSRTEPGGVILALSHIRRIGAHEGSPDA